MTTAEETWRPLGFEGRESEYDALHGGVPEWMETSFWEWVRLGFGVIERAVVKSVVGSLSTVNRPSREVFDVQLLRKAERVLRFKTGYEGTEVRKGELTLRLAAQKNEGLELRIADFLLAEGKDGAQLNQILREAGSLWKVGERLGRPGLVRRVNEGVQLQAEAAMSRAGRAGRVLAQAWGEAFGVQPDPSNAYRLAVKAVEDAAIPVVIPNQDGATLGHVIGQLRNDGDWSLPFTREDSEAPTPSIVLRMCQALWKGHHDRHGASSHSIPEVTPEEAETAVTLAVSLVHWFASGLVARR